MRMHSYKSLHRPPISKILRNVQKGELLTEKLKKGVAKSLSNIILLEKGGILSGTFEERNVEGDDSFGAMDFF